MDEYVIPIFLIALAGVSLTLGAFFVRHLERAFVITMFGTWSRAQSPAAYWFWAVYYVAGAAWFLTVLAAVLFHFIFVG